MANGRNKSRKADSGRDSGGFVALPWSVLDSAAYASLSFAARSLLMEIARQYVRDNNGRLLASTAYLKKRGWNSSDVITRAKRELLAAGFIHETVKGHRPNKASWYAITWQNLDRLPGYDVGAIETFPRSAYRTAAPLKNASLRPSAGVEADPIAPSGGIERDSTTPPHGAIGITLATVTTPSAGNHLEMPSAATSVGLRKSKASETESVVRRLSQPSAVGFGSDRHVEGNEARDSSSTESGQEQASSTVFLAADEDDPVLDFYVARFLEEQERAERVSRMTAEEVDEFGYTKAMYEEEARGVEEIGEIFRRIREDAQEGLNGGALATNGRISHGGL